MHGRVTIAELARHSGVSKGTVSRALNGYRDVNPAARERIGADGYGLIVVEGTADRRASSGAASSTARCS